ncbi:MAG TPA: hexameric tyrosine-coordinated heme protein [Edaphocola sp.]|nr:hexameric tyrosine-coordinated heme protein [Edaphocola sp.]
MTNEIWLESLITDTPQEGRALAILMARKSIGAIQSDPEIKKQLREQYSKDAGQLIASAEVIALEFRTVAEANNYWRK